MSGDEIEKLREETIRRARDLAGRCQDVLQECEQYTVDFTDETPPDFEGFRVALHYATKFLNAVENSHEINEAWFEPLTDISICKDD